MSQQSKSHTRHEQQSSNTNSYESSLANGKAIYDKVASTLQVDITFKFLKDYLFSYEGYVFNDNIGTMSDRVTYASLRCLITGLIDRCVHIDPTLPSYKKRSALAYRHVMMKVADLEWFQNLLISFWVMGEVIAQDSSQFNSEIVSTVFAWRQADRRELNNYSHAVLRLRKPDANNKLYPASLEEVVSVLAFRLRELSKLYRNGFRVSRDSHRTWPELQEIHDVLTYVASQVPERVTQDFTSETGETYQEKVEQWGAEVRAIEQEAISTKLELDAKQQAEFEQRRGAPTTPNQESSGTQDSSNVGEWNYNKKREPRKYLNKNYDSRRPRQDQQPEQAPTSEQVQASQQA